jgi:thymidine kinase
MAKLYFRHGAMGSAKTLNLLAVRHNYERQGKAVKLCKPAVDTRFGSDEVTSRAGLSYTADIVLNPTSVLDAATFQGLSCVLVDEAQFLSPFVVDQLREMTRLADVPVICYGLRTDFRTRLFEGSRRLLEVADSIEEIKTTCQFCNRKAVFNLRHDEAGRAILDGPSVQLGGDERYSPTCYSCYYDKTAAARALAAPAGAAAF